MRLSGPIARRVLVIAILVQATGTVVAPSLARAAATMVFLPVADAAVYPDQPTTNFGAAKRLVADRSPKITSFLRFEVAGLTAAPAQARLRLWATDKSSDGPEIRRVHSPWDERTLTYASRPSVGSKVDDVGKVSANRWVEYEVGSLVTGNGSVEMALLGDSSDGIDFASREHGTPAHWPQLLVEAKGIKPPPPPAGGTFSFGLIGDTGYNNRSVERFLSVRDEMNKAGLDFTVHVGDIKDGSDPCPDNVYTENLDRFDGFHHPLLYTPGDNEWRDCANKGDRLAYLRRVFFSDDQSLGTRR